MDLADEINWSSEVGFLHGLGVGGAAYTLLSTTVGGRWLGPSADENVFDLVGADFTQGGALVLAFHLWLL
jgi:hypothetical protein